MNLYEILLYLRGKSEIEAREEMNNMGVAKTLQAKILACYDAKRNLVRQG